MERSVVADRKDMMNHKNVVHYSKMEWSLCIGQKVKDDRSG